MEKKNSGELNIVYLISPALQNQVAGVTSQTALLPRHGAVTVNSNQLYVIKTQLKIEFVVNYFGHEIMALNKTIRSAYNYIITESGYFILYKTFFTVGYTTEQFWKCSFYFLIRNSNLNFLRFLIIFTAEYLLEDLLA